MTVRSPRTVPTVCLITPGHVASTPRLVKEADALAEAGYRVHVVAGRHFAPAAALDDALLRRVRWSYTAVEPRPRGLVARKLARRAARWLIARQVTLSGTFARLAQQADVTRIADAAAATEADLFIGHCVAGLAAAAQAAEARAAPLGFDAEDYHEDETDGDAAARNAARALQRRLLPRCAYVTASAPLIAAAYRQNYGVNAAVVLNTFPRSDAPAARTTPAAFDAQHPARFYWFSQTIGPGRGLEEFLRVLGRLRTPAELELRGFVSNEYRQALDRVAATEAVARPLRFVAPAEPDAMVRLAADAHVGLSLEQRTPHNRDLCLTNKVFTYLLAGVPQLLTPTTAQQEIAKHLGAAALVSNADPATTAAALDALLSAPERYAAARATALELGAKRYCWDIEKETFLEAVRRVLPRR